MFIVCHPKDQSEDRFILFDKKDINLEELELPLELDEVIQFEDLISKYRLLPILSLNEFLLRIINPKYRTATHILGEIGINSFFELEEEYNKIEMKKSNLSKSQRDIVVKRYNELLTN